MKSSFKTFLKWEHYRPKGARTVQLSTRIRPEQNDLIKAVAGIIEEALTVFGQHLISKGKYKRMPLDAATIELARKVSGQ